MAKIKIKIGDLIEGISEYKNHQLAYNQEVSVSDLNMSIPTPNGLQPINHVIKKKTHGIKITFEDGHVLRCANKHILNLNNSDIYADILTIGDCISSINGNIKVENIEDDGENDYYDISIPSPHLYYDAYGIVHHNTLLTAALSHLIEPYGRSIIIVPSKSLVVQTEADYKNIGLDVGVYFGDRKEYNKTHTICTWQSLAILYKNSKKAGETYFQDFVEDVIAVIVDETHQAKADLLRDLLGGPLSNIPIRWGLTGTVPKEDHEYFALTSVVGPVVNKLSASSLQDKGVLAKCHVNVVQLQDTMTFTQYQDEYKYLVEDKDRLAWISQYIKEISKSGNTLVLCDRITTGEFLHQALDDSVFINGSTKLAARNEQYDEIQDSNNKTIVATYGVAAVGINIPRIFNLVLIEPGKSFIRVIQSIGRGIRKAQDKDYVDVYDFCSACKYSKRQLTVRKKWYTEANYPFTIDKVNWQE